MMYAIVVLRFWCIFFLVWQTWTVSSPDCSARLWKFAKAVSNFTFCAVSNSRPFRFCCHCKDVYGESLNGHKAIVEKKECHDDLIMAEKYQLVEYSYAFVVNLWESANCPGKLMHRFRRWGGQAWTGHLNLTVIFLTNSPSGRRF